VASVVILCAPSADVPKDNPFQEMMLSRLIGTAVVALFVCFAAPLRAQSMAASAADSTASTAVIAPAADSAAVAAPAATAMSPVGAHYASPARNAHDLSASGAHMGLGQSRALMIVGAAGILVGAIVGGQAGTVIMVSGAVVGLVGLYEYMQ
jgi:hypothetical protein